MNLSSALSPLRNRRFAAVWSGSFVSNVGTWMQAAALGYYTVHLTNSSGWGAAVASAEFAPTALLGSLGGAMADRYSRKTIFVTATLAQAVSSVCAQPDWTVPSSSFRRCHHESKYAREFGPSRSS